MKICTIFPSLHQFFSFSFVLEPERRWSMKTSITFALICRNTYKHAHTQTHTHNRTHLSGKNAFVQFLDHALQTHRWTERLMNREIDKSSHRTHGLPKSRAGGKGQWWNRPARQLGRSCNPKTTRKRQKSEVLPTDGQRGLYSRVHCTRN